MLPVPKDLIPLTAERTARNMYIEFVLIFNSCMKIYISTSFQIHTLCDTNHLLSLPTMFQPKKKKVHSLTMLYIYIFFFVRPTM